MKILFITIICMFISGCATLPMDPKWNEGQKGIFGTVKDMWNYDYSKDPIDWKQQAEFYRDNYPDCTYEEKAKMLTDSMTEHKDKFTTTKKEYTITVTQVYDKNGIQIWPVDKFQPSGAGQLSKFADTMNELGDKFENNKSAELSDIEKQVEKQDDVI